MKKFRLAAYFFAISPKRCYIILLRQFQNYFLCRFFAGIFGAFIVLSEIRCSRATQNELKAIKSRKERKIILKLSLYQYCRMNASNKGFVLFMKKYCCIALIVLVGLGCFTLPEAHGMDPVTIAILAPVAIKAAEAARPHVMRGMASGAAHMVKMGKSFFEIFYLPLGLLETTVGAPFGFLGSGFGHLAKGGIAPFKFALNAILFPVACCGISTGGM